MWAIPKEEFEIFQYENGIVYNDPVNLSHCVSISRRTSNYGKSQGYVIVFLKNRNIGKYSEYYEWVFSSMKTRDEEWDRILSLIQCYNFNIIYGSIRNE